MLPRNDRPGSSGYKGTPPARRGNRPPQALGDVLKRVLKDADWGPRKRKRGVGDSWQDAAGAELALETRPATLRKGVLTVEVRAPALLHELEGFRKPELLARLLAADTTGRITGLKFRLGVF